VAKKMLKNILFCHFGITSIRAFRMTPTAALIIEQTRRTCGPPHPSPGRLTMVFPTARAWFTRKLRQNCVTNLRYHFCNALLTNPAYEPVNCVTVVNLGTARVWKYSAKQHKHIKGGGLLPGFYLGKTPRSRYRGGFAPPNPPQY
jgi:hypothetical protein